MADFESIGKKYIDDHQMLVTASNIMNELIQLMGPWGRILPGLMLPVPAMKESGG
jgi:hypothetical protein